MNFNSEKLVIRTRLRTNFYRKNMPWSQALWLVEKFDVIFGRESYKKIWHIFSIKVRAHSSSYNQFFRIEIHKSRAKLWRFFNFQAITNHSFCIIRNAAWENVPQYRLIHETCDLLYLSASVDDDNLFDKRGSRSREYSCGSFYWRKFWAIIGQKGSVEFRVRK